MSDASKTPDDQIRLIDVDELALITGLSKPTLWRHHSAGLIPPAVRIGRSVRWRLVTIEQWINAGCPQQRNSVEDAS